MVYYHRSGYNHFIEDRLVPLLAAVLLVCFLCGGKAKAAEPAREFIALETTYQMLSAVDLATTLDIKKQCDEGRFRYEQNPLLGRHPSDGRVVGYFLATDALHALVTYSLYKSGNFRVARAFEYLSIGFEASADVHNFIIGLRVRL